VRKIRVRQYEQELKRIREENARRKRMLEIRKYCGVNITDSDRVILEKIVQAEAGNQDHQGKLLVANVILNRVKNEKFPSTIREVVFAPRQFSPIADGSYAKACASQDTKKAVDEALHGVDGSQGALYFMDRRYADGGNVSWFDRSLTRLFQHQGHEFYK
jgi:N-acetylmuramoyl-L-alanine amidase